MAWRVDWVGLYEPKHALLDVFLRGTIMYLIIFVLLRLVVRRQVGGIGITDILVIVLIAEVTGNGISDNFQSIGQRHPGLHNPILEHADRVALRVGKHARREENRRWDITGEFACAASGRRGNRLSDGAPSRATIWQPRVTSSGTLGP